MRFRKFVRWCNERICDSRWGTLDAMYCIAIISDIRALPIWKREKVWKEKYEVEVLEKIIMRGDTYEQQ